MNLAAGSFSPAVARQCRADRALVEQIEALGAKAGALIVHSQKYWASATYSGKRHRMTWGFEGAAAVAAGERLIAGLEHCEFDIPRQLVAEQLVTDVEHRLDPPHLRVELELLLLDRAA